MRASLDATFVALSDATRRGVIEMLRKQPRRASDLADALDASKPAMSRHLRVLRTSGLVEISHEDDARERIYRLRQEPFEQLEDWLREVQMFWAVQLDAFKAHVEHARGKAKR
jgi:DNA-binding transcriptional ArsR family regulator